MHRKNKSVVVTVLIFSLLLQTTFFAVYAAEKTYSNICGDTNNNGKITIEDGTVLQSYLAEFISENDFQISAADTNADGRINIRDVTEIQRYIAEIVDYLPSGKDIEVKSITLPDNLRINCGESLRVYPTITPEHATNRGLFWMSADDTIATVTDEGVVVGKADGKVKILVVSNNGIRATTTVTVINPVVPVTDVNITSSHTEPVYSGTQIQMNVSVLPDNATDKTVNWTSSNPDVASVDNNGKVTTKTAGTAVITATSSSGELKDSSVVKVNQMVSFISDGTYCFKLKDTKSYLDHQGGASHGTNVHLWEGDGNSNANQKIRLERIDDNRYMLWSAVESNLMLDVNRGTSYNDPLKIGLNIDLWENNDWQAQEWLFTKTYDGYYIIRLNMLQEGAIEATDKNNGANLFYGTYNCNNDLQKWELVNTSEYQAVETTAWVYNTGSIGNVHVRSGPGTTYSSIGGFNEGQEITVIGDTSAEWLHVRGANRHNGEIITGYSHHDYYVMSKVDTRQRDAWVYNTNPIGNVNVRQGPDTGYNVIGGFSEGQKITVIGELSNNWYNVRGADRKSGNIIEGYAHSDYITFEYRKPSGNEEIVFDFCIRELGMNTAAACGVLANVYKESGFNPTASCIDTNGLTSYGICQWNGGRFTNLKNYCSQNGYSYSSIEGQLFFLKYELNGSEWSAYSKIKNVENSESGAYTAGYNWARYFERCASSYYYSRAELAKNTYWPKYK